MNSVKIHSEFTHFVEQEIHIHYCIMCHTLDVKGLETPYLFQNKLSFENFWDDKPDILRK